MDSVAIQNLAYLVASVLFIFGLKGLTHPRTAVRGNLTSALAMLLAIVVTLWATEIVSTTMIIVGLAIGAVLGAGFALTVPMTGMPEMVGLFNGFGGAASVLVAGGALAVALKRAALPGDEAIAIGTPEIIATALSGLIGSVTFFGSMVAVLKLQEKVKSITVGGKKIWFSDSLQLPGRNLINAAVVLGTLALCVAVVQYPTGPWLYWALVAAAAVLGVLITIPIGGADMPVVIALLNSYSGLAACATGFVINNNVLIIAGALVGASGLVLTKIMCKAMNRSLANVIFATMGPTADTPSADDVYAGKVKSTSADEVAMLFDTAQRVVIVPGYGMAVSQAQHAVRDLANLLESRGITVEFGIHPVAGRMPGHMNVLLAEANIDYDKLLEMDVINPTLETVDVALVVGANDVVNPVAREEGSAISGMPIIDVDKCRTVVVIKRSLSPGFAGIPNPLFAADNTLMFFNDAKKAFTELVTAVKES
ncbi:MAG: NAD(P)(+) transhydrogenase (Re/Si-specific) subunit beta [Planctomycetes bacterium]|nr:NAD(P)(+) transhydrogenase (Re/Si-specific) subunit beta [Planctomycetota bacterium]